jgi:alkylation response protein AidB-like acyl-CoA dehydrogenase
VDFELGPDHRALSDAARAYLARRWGVDRMLAALDAPPATIDEDVWTEVGSMQWPGIAVPEELGGSGGDLVGAAVLCEEAGRALFPGPLQSAIAAAAVLVRSSDELLPKRVLPDVCAGRTRMTIALDELARAWEDVATKAVDGPVVSGTKLAVPDATGAELLLVAAEDGLLVVAAAADGVTITQMTRFDAQSIAEVRLDDVLAEGIAGDARLVRYAHDVRSALVAADLLGTADAVLERTTAYAKERKQFGRPIGSFQAVGHRLADMLMRVEVARGLVWGACLALDERRPDASALVSAAKAWASDTAVTVTEDAVQLHGGIGYTWELGLHLWVRRASANAATAGTAQEHRDRIARLLEDDWRQDA